MLLPQFGKEDGRDAVAEEDGRYIYNKGAVAVVPQRCGYGLAERHHAGQESQVKAGDGKERPGIDLPGIFPFLVGKAETPRFKPQHQNHLKDGDVGHKLRNHAVLYLRKHTGVQGHEHKVENPCKDGTETVDGGFSGQLFERICHIIAKLLIFAENISKAMKKFMYIVLAAAAIVACKGRGGNKENVEPAPVEPTDTVVAMAAAKALPATPVFDIVTNMGTITVRLFSDTPLHRNNFEKLALSGYYDDLLFHRVINGFMIQGGDPYTRDTSKVELYGQGGPSYTIPAEMRDSEGNPLHRHVKGALAAARRGDIANPFKESSGSQFYIVQNPDNCKHLDGEYTVFGETVSGFNVIDKIAGVKTDRLDRPVSDVRIISIKPDKELNQMQSSGTDIAEEKTE